MFKTNSPILLSRMQSQYRRISSPKPSHHGEVGAAILLPCYILIPSGIDLTSLLSQLDASASEILANQKDALIERKEVAQKTKDFRKLDDAGKLNEYKTLLKGV